MSNLRQLHLRGALGAARTETYDGREHLVVPCIALQEGVIHAVNASTPEFVSRAALTKSHEKWHGHPLVLGHPTRDGKQISAHDAAVLLKHGFGTIRAPRMSGNRLGLEALVDPKRLEALGQQRLLADLRAGKPIEVSVGAFVTTNGRGGVHNGKAYKAEWIDIVPDHLAFLPDGVGACSLEMGCGAHRAAMRVCADGFELEALGDSEGHPFHGNQHTGGLYPKGSPAEKKAATAHFAAATVHESIARGDTFYTEEHATSMTKEAHALSEKIDNKDAITQSKKAITATTSGDHKAAAIAHREANIEHKATAEARRPAKQGKTNIGKRSRILEKGLSTNLKSLRAKMLALFDTPEQAASEEAADLRAGKPIEVSVGAFVTTNGRGGVHNGKAYKAEWIDIVPDHLAFLPDGVGACSLEMGCGAHRAAMRVCADGFELEALGDSEGHPFHGNQHTGGLAEGHPDHSVAKGLADMLTAGQHLQTSTINQYKSKDTKHSEFKATLEQHLAAKGLQLVPRTGTTLVRNSRGGASIGKAKGYTVKEILKGAQMNAKSLKERILALFDTPEQAASEEAAELIAYNSMRTLFDGIGTQWDEASGLIDDLIADEEENPTETGPQEEAETEVEGARLEAIRMLCYAMISALQNVVTVTYEEMAPDMPTPSDPRYMEQLKALIGKAISAKNLKVVQGAHDASHDTHAHTVALGAQCNGMKLLAEGNESGAAEQKPCGCGGSSAETEETDMTKADRIAALLKHEHNPLKDQKALEAADEKTLVTLEAHCETLKAAADKSAADAAAAAKKKEEDDAKAAAMKTAAQSEEDYLKTAPESIRTLVAEKKAQDEAEKAKLVADLKSCGALTEAQLKEKPLEELRTLAKFAKIEQPNYSGNGVPRAASTEKGSYAPPDPYAAGLKALRESKTVN